MEGVLGNGIWVREVGRPSLPGLRVIAVVLEAIDPMGPEDPANLQGHLGKIPCFA